jgi:hypothetical protein
MTENRENGASRAPVSSSGPRLTRADLDAGIDLCGRYLLAAQRPGGDFVYEVDWTTGRESADDNPVRQAGATWGVALLYRETHDPAHGDAFGRAWGQWSPRSGMLGAAALIGLSLLERVAVAEGSADLAKARADLDALGVLLEGARLPNGGFAQSFDPRTGSHSGPADPYSSGEALLLLVRSGLELGVPDRVARALAWAEEDYDLFVAKPLAEEPDPDLTKGYYQWSSMVWSALASEGYAPEVWGRRLVEQALWMVDVHRTLSRTRNTGYAYEGLIPAWEWARRSGDHDTARKLAGVVHRGLRKLCSWQLGHPLASAALRSAPQRFHGGVQNHATKPELRIDVTGHQLHALILARRLGVDTAECSDPAEPESRRRSAAHRLGGGAVPS